MKLFALFLASLAGLSDAIDAGDDVKRVSLEVYAEAGCPCTSLVSFLAPFHARANVGQSWSNEENHLVLLLCSCAF